MPAYQHHHLNRYFFTLFYQIACNTDDGSFRGYRSVVCFCADSFDINSDCRFFLYFSVPVYVFATFPKPKEIDSSFAQIRNIIFCYLQICKSSIYSSAMFEAKLNTTARLT